MREVVEVLAGLRTRTAACCTADMASLVAVSRFSDCTAALQFIVEVSAAGAADSARGAVPVLPGGASVLRALVMRTHVRFSMVSLEANCINRTAWTTAQHSIAHIR